MKQILISLITCTFFLLINLKNVQAQVAIEDSLALVDFRNAHPEYYDSYEIPKWKNSPVSQWEGVTVINNRVVKLNIAIGNSGFHQALTIPPSFKNLTALVDLSFRIPMNEVDGDLSPLKDLPNLKRLSFTGGGNGPYYGIVTFNSVIPSLTYLSLNLPVISGDFEVNPFPPGITQSTNLDTLMLSGIRDSIPYAIGNLTNLKFLLITAGGAWGGGTIPNKKIPASIGLLTKLQNLDLSYFGATGRIPSFLGNLTNLEVLNLSYNQLIDSIPATFGNFTKLKILKLNNNQLNFNIPSSIGNLTSLHTLYLNNNQLTDPIPDNFSNLSSLQIAFLNSNKLGALPSTLGNLSKLKWLFLQDNQLKGPIPSSIGNMSVIKTINFSNNQLSGSLPVSIGNITSIDSLILSNNKLTGNIPESVGGMSGLGLLDLSGNLFSGNIPSSIGNLASIKTIDLSSNQLSGSIPENIGNALTATNIYLKDNKLTGTLPVSLTNITGIVNFDASTNQLTGIIPSSYSSLTNLVLNISYNKIWGKIPSTALMKGGLMIRENSFTFDGMEQAVQREKQLQQEVYYEYNFIEYAPQYPVPLKKNGTTLYVSVGGTPDNNTYKWYKNASPTSTLVKINYGDSTFTPVETGTYYVVITNDIATDLILVSEQIPLNAIPVAACTSDASLTTSLTGTSYQWQVGDSTGNNFTDVAESQYYIGSTMQTLYFTNIPTTWYGNTYRCKVDQAYGTVYKIQLVNTWTGTVNNAWENPANWSCGVVPQPNTDIVINSGNVVLNSNATCKTLTVGPGANFTVATGYTLTITN